MIFIIICPCFIFFQNKLSCSCLRQHIYFYRPSDPEINRCGNEKIYYPEYLDEFIENRLKDWFNAAFSAIFDYEINKNYIINKDKNNNDVIQPIDFSNTGIIRQNSVWNGLHQFLQIKHGLRLTEENLSSCFISNLIFFKLYKNLYGFTGTLGSLKTQEAIKEIYNIELV